MIFFIVTCLSLMILFFSISSRSFPYLFIGLVAIFYLFVIIPPLRSSGRARLPDGFFLGINYPGVSVGYRSGGHSLSLRWFSENDINIIGSRYKGDLFEFREGRLFWALDVYRPEFTSEFSQGKGYMLGVVGGTEILIDKKILFTTDIGPHWVRLEDEETGLKQKGIEFVVNFGFNIYL